MSWTLQHLLMCFFAFCVGFGVVMICLDVLDVFSLTCANGLLLPLVWIGTIGIFITMSVK